MKAHACELAQDEAEDEAAEDYPLANDGDDDDDDDDVGVIDFQVPEIDIVQAQNDGIDNENAMEAGNNGM